MSCGVLRKFRSRPHADIRHAEWVAVKQSLRRHLASRMDLLVRRLNVTRDWLPALRDAAFMLGRMMGPAQERDVLREINVSSVAPYPESANAAIVAAVRSVVT
jgi:hypothetical protein